MSFELTAQVLKIWCRSPGQKLVMMCLAHHAQDDGTRIYPGIEAIGRVAQLNERSVRRLLAEMVRMGLLTIVEHGRGGRGKVTHYAMNVEFVAWLRTTGADLGQLSAARVPWPECRSGAPPMPPVEPPEKPGHDVRVYEAETRTSDAVNPDIGSLSPPHTPPLSRTNPDPPCAQAHTPAHEAAAAAGLFQKFREGYPKPTDGEWRVWGDVEFNQWPKLDAEQRRQAVESLPAFAAEVRQHGRTRLCNPKTYLVSKRFVDYFREATRPRHEDQVFVRQEASIWEDLQAIWRDDNPDRPAYRQGTPVVNGGWYFKRSMIARAHRRAEAGGDRDELPI